MGTPEQLSRWKQWIINKIKDPSFELGQLGLDEDE